MQTAIVIVIVAVTAGLLIRRFYNNLNSRGTSACGCGCDGCGPSREKDCSAPRSSFPIEK